MYNLIRFFNQNRRKIIIIILLIVFFLGIIQILNYLSKEQNKTSYSTPSTTQNISIKNEVVSEKSAINGNNVPSKKLKSETDVIGEFLEYCNMKKIDQAYNILTDECKEEMFPTLEDFNRIYYMNIFKNEYKSYTIENWSDETYQVKFSGDILATGRIDDDNQFMDYITVFQDNGEYKLNINNYLGREEIKKTTEFNDISITINSVDKYMDYEVYKLLVENKSNNTILLDTSDSTKSIYVQDGEGVNHYFYNNEVIENKLKIILV